MRKLIALIALFIMFPILDAKILVAQDASDLSVCEYKETRNPVSINPKTNRPYTPDDRNQESFAGASITKDEIRRCLQAKTPIKNHHIVFEDYRDVWQELAKETGDYAIPLLIEGGAIKARSLRGIDLSEFRDPKFIDASNLIAEQGKTLGIEKKDGSIAFVRSEFKWRNISINAEIGTWQEDLAHIIFSNVVNFRKVYFKEVADFSRFNFIKGAYFNTSNFIKGVRFNDSNFSDVADFWKVRFNGIVLFRRATFNGMADFSKATFNGSPHFSRATFSNLADFSDGAFSDVARFDGTNFNDEAIFSGATFSQTALFRKARFSDVASFSGARFGDVASFDRSIFFGKAYFGGIIVSSQLVFDSTTWKKRIDFRGISTKELHWDSTNNPSDVQGIADFRGASMGKAMFNEVHFHDLVDFSRTTFGRYEERITGRTVTKHPSPQVLFENVTFDNEADFLHIKFHSPAIFIENRFRKALGLTGSTFGERDRSAPVCLSYNRINRLVFESKHLGNVRRIDAPDCLAQMKSDNPSGNGKLSVEPLPNIYKTLEKAFKDANDQKGVNEAWYLGTVAKRDQADTGNFWSFIWAKLSWIFGDIPSRYAVDVWRTVDVSITIMVCFYVVYLLYFAFFNDVIIFSHLVRGKDVQEDKLLDKIQLPESSDRHRAFRFRPFESLYSKQDSRSRPVIPWWDAATLSIRSFTKLGLGTIYPKTRLLKIFTNIEWALGIYMLILFILAVKNNLPFILPFLGVVH